MRLDRADVTMSNTLVLKNTVSASGQSYGGGILMASGTAATFTGVTIAGNSAVNLGGGLFIDDGTIISVAQSRIYHNSAGSGGGVLSSTSEPRQAPFSPRFWQTTANTRFTSRPAPRCSARSSPIREM